MNIDCSCGPRCGQTLQIGDPYRKTDMVIAVRIFGCRDGRPTVWLSVVEAERLIKELSERRDELIGRASNK
jgi:hypothetical protein